MRCVEIEIGTSTLPRIACTTSSMNRSNAGRPSFLRAWTCTSPAPASTARFASVARSSAVSGTFGHSSRERVPFSAATISIESLIAHSPHDRVEIGQLVGRSRPARRARGRARGCPRRGAGAPRIRHRQRLLDRVGRPLDVERVDRQRERAELLVRAGVLGEDQHAGAFVHERSFLRNQVHSVDDGVDEEDVVLLVGGDRLGEVVGNPEIDGRPPRVGELVIHLARRTVDRSNVLRIVGDLLPGRVQ